jgi:hypothetical protein
MSSPKNIVIGLGSGRCGTLSMSVVMNAQYSSCITHEAYIKLPWLPIYEYLELNCKIMTSMHTGFWVGDVAPYYLNYTDRIFQWFPNAKMVCLKRDKEATIKSLLSCTDYFESNHFTSISSKHWKPTLWNLDREESRTWRQCFPKYDASDYDAAGMYWEEYYKRAEKYEKKYPSGFKIFDTERTLNTQEGQMEMLDFAGFSSAFCIMNLKIYKGFEAHKMDEGE